MKSKDSIEPALTIDDFQGQIEEIGNLYHGPSQENSTLKEHNKQAHYAAIETAFRNIFYDLMVSLRRPMAFVRINAPVPRLQPL